MQITNKAVLAMQEHMLGYALALALTAPDPRVNDAIDVAENLSKGLSWEAINRAKRTAANIVQGKY